MSRDREIWHLEEEGECTWAGFAEPIRAPASAPRRPVRPRSCSPCSEPRYSSSAANVSGPDAPALAGGPRRLGLGLEPRTRMAPFATSSGSCGFMEHVARRLAVAGDRRRPRQADLLGHRENLADVPHECHEGAHPDRTGRSAGEGATPGQTGGRRRTSRHHRGGRLHQTACRGARVADWARRRGTRFGRCR